MDDEVSGVIVRMSARGLHGNHPDAPFTYWRFSYEDEGQEVEAAIVVQNHDELRGKHFSAVGTWRTVNTNFGPSRFFHAKEFTPEGPVPYVATAP